MTSYRPQRVANVVRSVVSDAIANRLNDPRIAPFSSVTRVEVSGDLEYAKVYVSVMGAAAVQRRTMEGLASAAGLVRRLVARELSIRQCPQLSFHLDESIKRAAETLRIIHDTMAEYEPRGAEAGAAGSSPAGEAPGDGAAPGDRSDAPASPGSPLPSSRRQGEDA